MSNQPQQCSNQKYDYFSEDPLTSSSFLIHALTVREFCLVIHVSSSRTLVFLGQFQDGLKKNKLKVRNVNVRSGNFIHWVTSLVF